MKAQRVDMFVCPSASPADTSGLQKLVDEGKVTRDSLVALVGKTDGTGFHDDWGRVWADAALREWTAKLLGVPKDEVAKNVIFVLSGGCPGVITPHIAAVTRDWVDVKEPNQDKRLVVGRAGSEAIAPEEVGRMGMMRKVASATREAMKDAAITDSKDVHLVMVKVPGLTVSSIEDAESRGHSVVSHDLTFGPEGAGSYANDAAALGVAMALGEVPESKLSDEVVRRDWDLYSEVAMTSSGGEKRHGEVVIFGNSTSSVSGLRIGHAVTRDFIDAQGVRDALRSAGLHFQGGLPNDKDLDRLVHVFAKSVIPGSDKVRGQHITLLDDHNAYQIGKALGGMLVASVTGRTTNYVSGGERNSHQGPPGGNIVAAVVR
ncbi:MAG TPA: ring-opening amidohydrolase, partial [Candidatus Dormibacteraeota bacterium]|nr:ring-opening amidohydrolase [Candidatus Dormibacteraeota bacterium]